MIKPRRRRSSSLLAPLCQLSSCLSLSVQRCYKLLRMPVEKVGYEENYKRKVCGGWETNLLKNFKGSVTGHIFYLEQVLTYDRIGLSVFEVVAFIKSGLG
eukprot:TRINITY_DN4084_c0_g1_i3.p2 TRINITY_DN4084_c0_g1~~TRINITY_DN4084_c0_g1_i3.p2  ORF type:complete len:100 (-),score=12.02 TRINITY_DN4084_c0_g1_i3:46-345(-)